MAHVLVAALVALIISLLDGPFFIDFLRRHSLGQHIREEGPQHHSVKQGTPTMGGILIVIAATIAFWATTVRTLPALTIFGTMLACGAMVVPPFIAAVTATKPILRPSLVTAALLVVVVITAGLAYRAPAYTFAQPQRRSARVLVEPGAATATYEVASQEPGLDLDPSAPPGSGGRTSPVGRLFAPGNRNRPISPRLA